MSLFLSIETATNVCSVAVSADLEPLSIITETEQLVHTRKATLMIEEAIKASGINVSDLDAIILSDGPGSYTGLRVGASIAKALCFGLEIALIPVNTLESLAFASILHEKTANAGYISMIDARRMEVYLAIYDDKGHCIQENMPYILTDASFLSLLDKYENLYFSGNGSPKFKDIVSNSNFHFHDLDCNAAHLIELGNKKYINKAFSDPAYYSPNYIKPPNITQSNKIYF